MGMGRCLNRKILSVSSIPGYRKIAPVSTFARSGAGLCKHASVQVPPTSYPTPRISPQLHPLRVHAWNGVLGEECGRGVWLGRPGLGEVLVFAGQPV